MPSASGPGPVRILQPIRSGDPRLPRFLAAMRDEHAGRSGQRPLRIDWLVDEDDPTAIDIARRLAEGAAEVEVVVCPPPPEGISPKSRKLRDRVRALGDDEIVVVVDDDTRCSRAGLDALLGELERGAMIATGLPRYDREGPLPARLVADWVNGQAATTYLGLPGEPMSINGMCHAMRVRELRAIGGYEAIERLVVDDLALAEIVRAAGGRIAQTAVPQAVGTEVADLQALVRLLHRWMAFANLAIRRATPRERARILRELAAPPVLLGASLALLATACIGRPARPGSAVAGVAVVLGARAAILERGWRGPGAPRPGSLAGAIAMELAVPLFTLAAWARPEITWRGRRMRLRPDGSLAA